MITGTLLTRILVVASLAALGAPSLYGQSGPNGNPETSDEARALILYARAESLLTDTDCWGGAAVLFERAARLFGPENPQAFTAMHNAAQLRYYTKDYDVALKLMAEAAEIGVSVGLDVQAADAYLDAAILAVEQRHPDARALLTQAVKLAKSPRLTADERLAFEQRLRLHGVKLASR
jgi:tetratricopeptide (TPR) repeat protein